MHNDIKVLLEYERQLYSVHKTQCDAMYSDCVEFSNFSGCVYYHVNNSNLGTFESNMGGVTLYSMTTGRYNGRQNIDLNSSLFDNQNVAVVTSQHNDLLVGEVQPHH